MLAATWRNGKTRAYIQVYQGARRGGYKIRSDGFSHHNAHGRASGRGRVHIQLGRPDVRGAVGRIWFWLYIGIFQRASKGDERENSRDNSIPRKCHAFPQAASACGGVNSWAGGRCPSYGGFSGDDSRWGAGNDKQAEKYCYSSDRYMSHKRQQNRFRHRAEDVCRRRGLCNCDYGGIKQVRVVWGISFFSYGGFWRAAR